MMSRCLVFGIVTLSLYSTLAADARAAEKSDRATTITDVTKVTCDIKLKTVTVSPTTERTLSPKKLWEALEEIGKTPKKLKGPSGTFTSKPKS